MDKLKTKTIVFANQKGGVGKTTAVINTATKLINDGKAVLIIDLDPQASTTHYFLPADAEIKTIIDVINSNSSLEDVVLEMNTSGLIGANQSLINFDSVVSKKALPQKVLFKLIETIKNQYDYIIVDCPGAAGQLQINALVSADYVVLVNQASLDSFACNNAIYNIIDDIKEELNPNIKVAGVLINDYESRNIKANVLDVFKDWCTERNVKLFSIIRHSTSVQVAKDSKLNLFSTKSNGSEDYSEFINQLKKEVK